MIVYTTKCCSQENWNHFVMSNSTQFGRTFCVPWHFFFGLFCYSPCEQLCSHYWYIGFNGAEINCGIAKILGILQMNSYLSYGLQILRFFKTTTSLLSSLCRVNNYYKSICGLQLFNPGGGVLPYMGCIGMCNELALVKVKGSRRPAAHPHPEIPKVPPRVFNRGLKQGRRRRQWKGR